jgi:Ca2+-binding EF-hand superfamily protein
MMRWLYIQLLWMHPRTFRQRFGDEMLGIFDQSAEKRSLIVDGVVSLLRQWALRPSETGFAATASADGVPLFYTAGPEIPSTTALMRGAILTFFLFGVICFVTSHRWKQTTLIVGSHHPSPSNILGAHTDARAETDLPAEVKVPPYPYHPPLLAYFRLILVLGALDADQDNIISAAEIEDAPSALRKLDTNHDGKLTAEECGLKPDPNIDLWRQRITFMRIHPVLAALDANHDGEISESEIRNSARALRTLDFNGDGKLTEHELYPDGTMALAANIMLVLDKNGDGRISQEERVGRIAERFRAALNLAERDGFVKEEDLVSAIGKTP